MGEHRLKHAAQHKFYDSERIGGNSNRSSEPLFRYRKVCALPVYATPFPNVTEFHGLGNNSMLALIDSTNKPPMRRSLFGILWSCMLTVIICTWSSIHPNLPPRCGQRALLRRIKLMFWTIVAPEVVLVWAVRQWFAAKEVMDTYNQHEVWNQRNWTMEHGHFLIMGCYQLVSEDIKKLKEPYKPGWIVTREDLDAYDEYQRSKQKCQLEVLTLARFKQLMEDPNLEFPMVTVAEIKDKSKGDGLSKLIAILQTSWFIAQCVDHGFQKLALTELELVTLAMASLNAITFMFWLSKPLGVKEPVNIYIPAGLIGEPFEVKEEVEEGDHGVTTRGVMKILDN